MKQLAIGFMLLLVSAACTTPPPAVPTSEALLTDGYMPKVIVTIDLADTPLPNTDETEALATPTPQPSTPIAIFPSDTPPPYVGVFLGAPTSDSPATFAPIPLLPETSPAVAGSCGLEIAAAFQNAQGITLGCPRDAGLTTGLVTQRFERGRMFWRDTRQVIIISDDGTFWRTVDTWNEGVPADDPALTPPEGASQPIRGFGLIWRGNQTFRDALGWALGPEFPIASVWQEFDGGSVFLGDGGAVYAVPNTDTGQYTRSNP